MLRHRAISSTFVFIVALTLSACGGGGGGSGAAGNGLIDVTEENALTDALVVRFGEKLGRKTEGDLPTKTATGSEPVISPAVENRAATNGETVDLDLQIDSTSPLGSLLLKVVGADSFLAIRLLEETENKASISETLEIDIPTNITDGTFCVEIVAVDDQDRVSEVEQICIDVQSTADDDPAPAAFTVNFLEDRAFYLDVVDASTGGRDSVRQLVFNADRSGSVLFDPTEDNRFATDDVNPIAWSVTNDGELEYTEFGSEGEELLVTITPTAVGANSASFTCLVKVDGETEFTCAESSMTAANASLYTFLSERTFDVDIQDSDIELLVFNRDGTGSVRFAPNEDNDFNQNDINNLHWQALESDRLVYTEFGGDGYDRDETNCEDDPNVDCSLDPYLDELNFTSIGANSASFDYESSSDDDGTFTSSGSMNAAADEQNGGGSDVLQQLQGTWSFACSGGESDDGTPESFSGSWLFSGTNLTVTESLYEGNTTCSGQASADSPFTEEFIISIGQETVADDGGPATELDIFEEGALTDLCIVRVEQDRFLLGCEGQEPRATTFNEGEFVREE